MSLGNMSPGTTHDDSVGLRSLKPEQRPDFSLEEFAVGGELPNAAHVVGGDLCCRLPLSPPMAVFCDHIGHVIQPCADEQMQGIKTVAHVAGMKDFHFAGNGADNSLINKAMRKHRFIIAASIQSISKMDQRVAGSEDAGCPEKTRLPLDADSFDSGEDKSLCNFGRHAIIVYQNGGKNL